MNRHLQARRGSAATPFRAVSLDPARFPARWPGRAPAVAMNQHRASSASVPAAGARVAAAASRTCTRRPATTCSTAPARRRSTPCEFLKKADPSRLRAGAGRGLSARPLGDGLRQIAQLIKADVGLEVAFAEIGGWDHHAAEGGARASSPTRLRDFGRRSPPSTATSATAWRRRRAWSP